MLNRRQRVQAKQFYNLDQLYDDQAIILSNPKIAQYSDNGAHLVKNMRFQFHHLLTD